MAGPYFSVVLNRLVSLIQTKNKKNGCAWPLVRVVVVLAIVTGINVAQAFARDEYCLAYLERKCVSRESLAR